MAFFMLMLPPDQEDLPDSVSRQEDPNTILDPPRVGDIFYVRTFPGRGIQAVGIVRDVNEGRAFLAWLWPAGVRSHAREGLVYPLRQQYQLEIQKKVIQLLLEGREGEA